MVQHLHSMHEALGSTHSTTKKIFFIVSNLLQCYIIYEQNLDSPRHVTAKGRIFFFFELMGIEPRALHILGKH
jgi:hypothetical protein